MRGPSDLAVVNGPDRAKLQAERAERVHLESNIRSQTGALQVQKFHGDRVAARALANGQHR